MFQKMNIKEIKSNKPDEEFIDDSGWLDDIDPNKFNEVHQKMNILYKSELTKFVSILGQPDFNEVTNQKLAAQIYFEAINLSMWKHDDGFLYLAYGQHDKETPVFVSCGFRKYKT